MARLDDKWMVLAAGPVRAGKSTLAQIRKGYAMRSWRRRLGSPAWSLIAFDRGRAEPHQAGCATNPTSRSLRARRGYWAHDLGSSSCAARGTPERHQIMKRGSRPYARLWD